MTFHLLRFEDGRVALYLSISWQALTGRIVSDEFAHTRYYVYKEQKQKSIAPAQVVLNVFREKGDGLVIRIVSGDETWVHRCRQSMVWKPRVRERRESDGYVVLEH